MGRETTRPAPPPTRKLTPHKKPKTWLERLKDIFAGTSYDGKTITVPKSNKGKNKGRKRKQ